LAKPLEPERQHFEPGASRAMQKQKKTVKMHPPANFAGCMGFTWFF